MIIPIAAFIESVVKSNYLLRTIILGITGFCIWFNCLLTWQAHASNSIYESEYMTKEYFWKIFGKTKYEIEDKKLLDTPEEFHGERTDIEQLYFNDFENDTLIQSTTLNAFSGSKSAYINREVTLIEIKLNGEKTENKEWVRVSCAIFAPIKEWDVWQMHTLDVSYLYNGKSIKSNQIRIDRLYNEGTWSKISFETKIPDYSINDIVVRFDIANGSKMLL